MTSDQSTDWQEGWKESYTTISYSHLACFFCVPYSVVGILSLSHFLFYSTSHSILLFLLDNSFLSPFPAYPLSGCLHIFPLFLFLPLPLPHPLLLFSLPPLFLAAYTTRCIHYLIKALSDRRRRKRERESERERVWEREGGERDREREKERE